MGAVVFWYQISKLHHRQANLNLPQSLAELVLVPQEPADCQLSKGDL